MAEIDRLNKKLKGKITLLKGSECDILKDGTLDLPDKILAKLDIVGVSVHSYFNLPRAEQTERIKRAMANPNVDILFHPTGRIINRRPAYDVDMEELVATAKHTGTDHGNRCLSRPVGPERRSISASALRRALKCLSIPTRIRRHIFHTLNMASRRRGGDGRPRRTS